MSKVAFLGLGAMGSRMVANLLRAGHEVTVWNRTAATAEPVVAAGAKLAGTPKEAATDVEFVFSMVRDDEASREVWLDPINGALAGIEPSAIAIESSTLTPEWVRELGKVFAAKKVALLEAPVSGSRPQAEAAQLVYLVGGDAEVLARVEPLLKVLGSSIQHVGELGAGALAKLATNTLMGVQVTTLAELIGMLKRQGADPKKVLDAVAATPAWSTIATRATGSMLSENFAPQFPVELIEKDFRYTLKTAGGAGHAPTIEASRSVFHEAIEEGFGGEQMTAVVKLFQEN
ncbi:NAD(P)-dependent oxidoreductase [Silvibacterium acidisoli]|uniref:NAD(P)-dependent oxidoreductase n=1 Tax=Acidobacteriaceae bacterium ZG23-2 TaxID=2883246 RepID=UPI00406D0396